MKIKVMYHSTSGNTRKIAEAIASAVGSSAEAITENYSLTEPVDLLFIGDGIYAGKMNKLTQRFISTLDKTLVKNAAVFGTYGGQDKVITTMKELLENKGIHVCADTFACKGQAWLIGNRKHPNKADIDNATKFGNGIVKSITSTVV